MNSKTTDGDENRCRSSFKSLGVFQLAEVVEGQVGAVWCVLLFQTDHRG